jgi:GT2 family glycosyltransferase
VFGSYNVAIRRDVLERTRGFDESYRRASAEDNDLSYRITSAGFRIAFAQRAIVAHYHPESLLRYLREQYRHGFWRMKLYRSHPGMAGGDDYTVIKDVVEPPLAVATLASLVMLPFVWWLTPALAVVLLAVQFPAAVRIARRTGDWSHLALAPVTFLRGFARGLGMCAGIARFYLHLGHAQ